MIEKVVEAADRKKLVAAVRALDRVLLWEYYVVPHWYVPSTRLVYWDKFGKPAGSPMKGVQLMSWWIDGKKDAALRKKRAGGRNQAAGREKTVFQQVREWF